MKKSLRNNKSVRKARAKQRPVVDTNDGTEVLRTSAARIKLRRWTFEADVSVQAENDDMMHPQRLTMTEVIYGTAKEARAEIPKLVEALRTASGMFDGAKIKMKCLPHETVSVETISQLNKSQNMSMVLDKALEFVLLEGCSEFDRDNVGVFTLAKAKEQMFKKAVDWYKEQDAKVVPIDGVEETADETADRLEPTVGNMSAGILAGAIVK